MNCSKDHTSSRIMTHVLLLTTLNNIIKSTLIISYIVLLLFIITTTSRYASCTCIICMMIISFTSCISYQIVTSSQLVKQKRKLIICRSSHISGQAVRGLAITVVITVISMEHFLFKFRYKVLFIFRAQSDTYLATTMCTLTISRTN